MFDQRDVPEGKFIYKNVTKTRDFLSEGETMFLLYENTRVRVQTRPVARLKKNVRRFTDTVADGNLVRETRWRISGTRTRKRTE